MRKEEKVSPCIARRKSKSVFCNFWSRGVTHTEAGHQLIDVQDVEYA